MNKITYSEAICDMVMLSKSNRQHGGNDVYKNLNGWVNTGDEDKKRSVVLKWTLLKWVIKKWTVFHWIITGQRRTWWRWWTLRFCKNWQLLHCSGKIM